VPALRRVCARSLVPRAAVRAQKFQHLEVPALRRTCARPFVTPEAILAHPLQYFELSLRRRQVAQAFVFVFFVFPQVTVVQLTVLMHELQRA
jgi:hypothetical protein